MKGFLKMNYWHISKKLAFPEDKIKVVEI